MKRAKMAYSAVLLSLLALLLMSLSLTSGAYFIGEPTPAVPPTEATSAPAADDQAEADSFTQEHEADVATEWMLLLYDRIRAEGISAPGAARLYGYAGITLYHAVVPGMPNNFTLNGVMNGLQDVPYIDPELNYDWPSAAAGALSTLLAGFFDTPSQETLQAVNQLRETQIAARKALVNDAMVERSVAFGDSVAQAVLMRVNSDGYSTAHQSPYTIPTGDPALWEITSLGQEPVEPFWGQILPFAMPWSAICNTRMNLDFSEEAGSTFYLQAQEVLDTGRSLTNEQREIARYWIDSPVETGTPAGHWIIIGVQIVDWLDLKLDRTAEMFALLNMAVADAFISAWQTKYEINLLRPVTYINRYLDPAWRPYVETPPFPEYPSGHSVVSAAASEVLTAMFGTVAFTDQTHIIVQNNEPLVRSFTSFEAAASEAAISRLYGGIHFRIGIENGIRQGRCVGQQVLNNLPLRPIPQGE